MCVCVSMSLTCPKLKRAAHTFAVQLILSWLNMTLLGGPVVPTYNNINNNISNNKLANKTHERKSRQTGEAKSTEYYSALHGYGQWPTSIPTSAKLWKMTVQAPSSHMPMSHCGMLFFATDVDLHYECCIIVHFSLFRHMHITCSHMFIKPWEVEECDKTPAQFTVCKQTLITLVDICYVRLHKHWDHKCEVPLVLTTPLKHLPENK